MYSDTSWFYFLSILSCLCFRQTCIYRWKADATRSRLWCMCYFLAVMFCLVCTHGALDGTKGGANTSCPNSTFFFFHLWVSLSIFLFSPSSLLIQWLCLDWNIWQRTPFWSFLTLIFICWDVFLHYMACINTCNFILFQTLVETSGYASLRYRFPIKHIYQSI